MGTKKNTMNTCKVFPDWLYNYIFEQLGAKERPDPNEFKLNLESGSDKNIDYLGTYFPKELCRIILHSSESVLIQSI